MSSGGSGWFPQWGCGIVAVVQSHSGPKTAAAAAAPTTITTITKRGPRMIIPNDDDDDDDDDDDTSPSTVYIYKVERHDVITGTLRDGWSFGT